MKMPSKPIAEIVKRTLAAGGTLRHKKHFVLRFPNGSVVTFPKTPGDPRSNNNALAALRRAERKQ